MLFIAHLIIRFYVALRNLDRNVFLLCILLNVIQSFVHDHTDTTRQQTRLEQIKPCLASPEKEHVSL
jgi:hypothetical protein